MLKIKLKCDAVNADFGERLAVTVFLAVAFAAFLVKHDDFVAFHVTKHAGAHTRTFNIWCADGDIAVVLDKMHGVEGDFVTFIGCQPVDEDLLTFLNFELLTGDGNNCEHIENQKFGEKTSPFLKKAGKGTSTWLKKQAGFKVLLVRR